MKSKCVIYVICMVCITNSCRLSNKEEFEIAQFYAADSINYRMFKSVSKDSFNCKFESYLISGYEDSQEFEIKLDSFACNFKDSTYTKYDQYSKIFYKKSEFTNNEHIQKNPRDIDRYSQENDLQYSYTWHKGQFIGKLHHKRAVYSKVLHCD
jgi:hypothetical protein